MPLLGINFGHVGFLTMVERKNWQIALEATIAGRCRVQHGPTLDTQTLIREEKSWRRAGSSTTWSSAPDRNWSRSNSTLTGNRQHLSGDGMIVSTPQGSTAYCMSAGGPILTRGVRGFVIIALNPHSPIRIPLVVEEESEIDLVTVNDKPSWLYLDGNIKDAPALAARRHGPHAARRVHLRDGHPRRYEFLQGRPQPLQLPHPPQHDPLALGGAVKTMTPRRQEVDEGTK